jgi:long-chain acyl-CoA synthetase
MHYRELDQAWAELTGPGAPFELETIQVRGVSLKAYRNAPRTIRDFWLASRAFADRDYLVYRDERITYADAHRRTASIAAWLLAQGVRRGDRIAIGMRNYPEWMLIYWAGVSIGVAVVGLNAWWTTAELDYALKDSAPKVIFCDAERLERVLQTEYRGAGAILVSTRMDAPPAGVAAFSGLVSGTVDMPSADVDPDDDACIFYTSGTTGFPKGAQLTQRGCVTNLFHMLFAAQSSALSLHKATGVPPPPPPIPAGLITTPLFHVTANNCGAYALTALGGKMVLMFKWDPLEALKLVERERITSLSGVPVMAREVLNHPEFGKHDTSSLLSMGGGGAPLPPDLVNSIEKAPGMARPNTGYGMTETCGIITSVSGDFFVDKPTSCGRAMPAYDVRCVGDDGQDVAPGGIGEIWVKGASVIKGYINRPEATAQSITDGWLHTGDVGRIDAEGFIHLVDRKKDMVLRGGENVYCAEVEACLFRHAAVADCTVFGVPDERLGEEVAAVVVVRPGFEVAADALREHCYALISRFKAPRYIWIRSETLPRNANGKVLKRQLRDELDLSAAS